MKTDPTNVEKETTKTIKTENATPTKKTLETIENDMEDFDFDDDDFNFGSSEDATDTKHLGYYIEPFVAILKISRKLLFRNIKSK